MSEFLGKLEVVEVNNGDRGLELTFYHKEAGEVRTVKFNKQAYNQTTGKFENDADQLEKFEKNCREILLVDPDQVAEVIGKEFDVWETDTYCALWEPKSLNKFEVDMVGQILTAEVSEIRVYDAKAQIVLVYAGKEYGSNINWGNYVASLKKSLPDPQKRKKQLDKFAEKFHVSFDDREELIGTDVMIEVKRNNMDTTGSNPTYVEVKALPKR